MPEINPQPNEPEEAPTPVIFRKWRSKTLGDGVIAIFPTIPSDSSNWYNCEMFEHHGQHGGGDYLGVVQQTRLAKPEEYADLKLELESAPYEYKLVVYRKETSKHRELREKEWRQGRG